MAAEQNGLYFMTVYPLFSVCTVLALIPSVCLSIHLTQIQKSDEKQEPLTLLLRNKTDAERHNI